MQQQNAKTIADAYGVAVRAGVITPQKEDEVFVRGMLGAPAASAAVLSDWAAEPVRKPITIAKEVPPQEGDKDA